MLRGHQECGKQPVIKKMMLVRNGKKKNRNFFIMGSDNDFEILGEVFENSDWNDCDETDTESEIEHHFMLSNYFWK